MSTEYSPERIAEVLAEARRGIAEGESRLVGTRYEGYVPAQWEIDIERHIGNRRACVEIIEQQRTRYERLQHRLSREEAQSESFLCMTRDIREIVGEKKGPLVNDVRDLIEHLRAENARWQKTKDLIRSIQEQCGDIRDMESQGKKCQPWTDEQAFNAFNRKLTEMSRDAFRDLGVLLGPDAVETLFGNNYPK